MNTALLILTTAGLLRAQLPVTALGPAEVVNHRILYVTGASGRIAAHALPGGQRLWESHQPARLIGILDGKPVGLTGCQAQGNPAWCLAVFDTAKGRQGQVARSLPLPFPDYAPSFAAGPGWDHLGHTYRVLGADLYIVAFGGSQGSFSLAWRALWRYSGGAAPPPSMVTRRNDAGVFQVSFPKGTVTTGPDVLSTTRFVPRPDHYSGPLAQCEVNTGSTEKLDQWLSRHTVSVACQPVSKGSPWKIDLEPILIRDYPPRP